LATLLLDLPPNLEAAMILVAACPGGSLSNVIAALYDYLCEGDGSNLIYFPIFNYNEGSLDVVRRMIEHPRSLAGLSDAGAHMGTVGADGPRHACARDACGPQRGGPRALAAWCSARGP
jgi:N-acyl-D-aspartate/D-glutamate deacylase